MGLEGGIEQSYFKKQKYCKISLFTFPFPFSGDVEKMCREEKKMKVEIDQVRNQMFLQ